MQFQEFVDLLYDAGWDSPCDAQHHKIKELWEVLFPVIAKLEAENKELVEDVVKLQNVNMQLQADINEYAEAQPPI